MKRIAKPLYISLAVLLGIGLLGKLIPSMAPYCEWITSPVALLIGLAYALLFGQPYRKVNKWFSKYLLQYSVVGLGFGMNLHQAVVAGQEGMLFSIFSVVVTMVLGVLLGKYLFHLPMHPTYLISSGTAICGGSAIAAVGPVMRAKSSDMTVALGVVFILNALALVIFPPIGRALELSQQDFGFWVAIAIHDTSSVVGAAQSYGSEALEVGTTIKLTRALWILPLALVTSYVFKNKEQKVGIPLFIVFFVVAILINTYLLGDYPQIGKVISEVARLSLTLSLFFIGASLSVDTIKSVGLKAFLLAVTLWVIISVGTLGYILMR